MRLVIPKLDVDVPVLDGVDEQTLLQGEGLYDYAQMPDETGGNVSIAGHRNWVRSGQITDDVPFYYLHTIGPGDCLYLVDDAHIYQYVWDQTRIIEPDDSERHLLPELFLPDPDHLYAHRRGGPPLCGACPAGGYPAL